MTAERTVATSVSRLSLELVESAERFAELSASWERLAQDAPTPFSSHAWFSAWWQAFGEPGALRVPVLWDGEELAAVYPLYAERGVLRAMANEHSPCFHPLARDADSLRVVTEAMLDRVASSALVQALAREDVALVALERAVSAAGAHILLSPTHFSPVVDTVGKYADWRASSRPRWGAPLERFRRKMLRENDARIRVVQAPGDLDSELRDGFAVEASGWKGRAGTAILSAPATERFYRTVARAAAARGELRISSIQLDGEPAAFDLTLLRHGRLYLLKTGFDERWRKLAPGLVLRLSVIERCFELGLAAHELLGDDSEWKRKFSTSGRLHVTASVYGNTPAQLLAYGWRGTLRPRLAWVARALRAPLVRR